MVVAFMTVIFWCASFVSTKIALRYMKPDVDILLRFTLALSVLGIAVILKRKYTSPDNGDWIYFIFRGKATI
jgi:uncharacterized membrane protein